jgi:hypothetical protein
MRTARWPADLALAAVVAVGLAARGGHANADPEIEKADQLFAEGKALIDSNLIQGCAKFDESLQYNPAAIGTLLNVALCDEKLGRVASAVAKFSEARDRAKEQGFAEHLRAAEQHIAALEPQVPHVTIELAETLPGTRVVLDDRVVALDRLANVAVDPGEREVVVSAPGRLSHRTRLIIHKAEHKDVRIPALARSITITSSRRRIGQIMTFAGAGALATGVGLGVYGRQLWREQIDLGRCQTIGDDIRCSSDGQAETDRARTLGNVGTVVGIAGAAVAGAGLYLWLRSPRSSSPASDKLTVVPHVAPDALGVVALGRF